MNTLIYKLYIAFCIIWSASFLYLGEWYLLNPIFNHILVSTDAIMVTISTLIQFVLLFYWLNILQKTFFNN